MAKYILITCLGDNDSDMKEREFPHTWEGLTEAVMALSDYMTANEFKDPYAQLDESVSDLGKTIFTFGN